MFLSRTVAAEICMEAKTNEHAYMALKRLDKEGILRFELSYVIGLPNTCIALLIARASLSLALLFRT